MSDLNILHTVQSKLRSLGFLTQNSDSKFRIFFVIAVNLLIYTISPLCFILFEGQSFGARTESFFFLSNGITTLISHIILISQKFEIFRFINDLKQIIENRKKVNCEKKLHIFYEFYSRVCNESSNLCKIQ